MPNTDLTQELYWKFSKKRVPIKELRNDELFIALTHSTKRMENHFDKQNEAHYKIKELEEQIAKQKEIIVKSTQAMETFDTLRTAILEQLKVKGFVIDESGTSESIKSLATAFKKEKLL